MVTLQEYLDQKYPSEWEKKQVKEISWNIIPKDQRSGKTDCSRIDLSEFTSLESFQCPGDYTGSKIKELILGNKPNLKLIWTASNSLTNLDLSKCLNLERINVSLNEFISVEFLSKLPYPSKMTKIEIYGNQIQPTDIAFFKPFVNLKELKLGALHWNVSKGRRNKFYGSLESLKDLNELERICIEATDVDRGLEYLTSLAKIQKKTQKYCVIECSPHSSDAKCKTIQDQLRPYNYDLEAWQLDHPELMKKVTKISDSERVQVVTTKIEEIKKELEQVKHNEPNKDKKIERLESKLKLLEEELGFLTKENRELRTTIRELEIKINSLTQKLEQINLISQIEISPK